jgi:hypothetical protein
MPIIKAIALILMYGCVKAFKECNVFSMNRMFAK